MKALVLVAHGSRRAESNQEVAEVCEQLKHKASAHFDLVEHAFLELAAPSIPDAIEQCIQKGAVSVRIVPYFLASGTHVVEDIPEQVAIKQTQYPELDIVITPYIGTANELTDILLNLAIT